MIWKSIGARIMYTTLRFPFRFINVNEPSNCVKNRKTDSNVYKIQRLVARWIYHSLMWALNGSVWFWRVSLSSFLFFFLFSVAIAMYVPCSAWFWYSLLIVGLTQNSWFFVLPFTLLVARNITVFFSNYFLCDFPYLSNKVNKKC